MSKFKNLTYIFIYNPIILCDIKMGIIITDGKELPKVARFKEVDIQLVKDLQKVFNNYGLKGKITRIEFDCGTPPHPELEKRCYRTCIPGPDDKPICQWICL